MVIGIITVSVYLGGSTPSALDRRSIAVQVFAGLDAAHDSHELPEQPAAEADRQQAAAGGRERRRDHQRQRRDDDLEREQRLETEDRQVAAAEDPQRQRREMTSGSRPGGEAP